MSARSYKDIEDSLRQLYVEDAHPGPVELGTADDADARGFCLGWASRPYQRLHP